MMILNMIIIIGICMNGLTIVSWPQDLFQIYSTITKQLYHRCYSNDDDDDEDDDDDDGGGGGSDDYGKVK